jgi:hypothetical protein
VIKQGAKGYVPMSTCLDDVVSISIISMTSSKVSLAHLFFFNHSMASINPLLFFFVGFGLGGKTFSLSCDG